MALLGDKLKILHFNPDLEDYTNKNFGYSELCTILPAPKGIIFEWFFVAKRKLFKYVYVYINNDA